MEKKKNVGSRILTASSLELICGLGCSLEFVTLSYNTFQIAATNMHILSSAFLSLCLFLSPIISSFVYVSQDKADNVRYPPEMENKFHHIAVKPP